MKVLFFGLQRRRRKRNARATRWPSRFVFDAGCSATQSLACRCFQTFLLNKTFLHRCATQSADGKAGQQVAAERRAAKAEIKMLKEVLFSIICTVALLLPLHRLVLGLGLSTYCNDCVLIGSGLRSNAVHARSKSALQVALRPLHLPRRSHLLPLFFVPFPPYLCDGVGEVGSRADCVCQGQAPDR